jgi:hypothetical protein
VEILGPPNGPLPRNERYEETMLLTLSMMTEDPPLEGNDGYGLPIPFLTGKSQVGEIGH